MLCKNPVIKEYQEYPSSKD